MSQVGVDQDHQIVGEPRVLVKRREPPSQGWRAFLRNHAFDMCGKDVKAANEKGTFLGSMALNYARQRTGRARVRGRRPSLTA